jgi:hypothetical protein
VPLYGGSGGGGGGAHSDEPDTGGYGGGGGGAVQLVAGGDITLEIGDDGFVDASGAGGLPATADGHSGGGGGSGGAILIEGLTVTINTILSANGGGGAGGDTYTGDGTIEATPGENGPKGNWCAAGGAAGGADAGAGGMGGCSYGPYGEQPADAIKTGGGGASSGRIRINSYSGSATLGSSAVVSPAADSGFSQGTVSLY